MPLLHELARKCGPLSHLGFLQVEQQRPADIVLRDSGIRQSDDTHDLTDRTVSKLLRRSTTVLRGLDQDVSYIACTDHVTGTLT